MKKMIAAGIVLLLPLLVLSQQQKFNYPVKHGTKTWDTITSYADRRSACQIPARVIARMSTETLLESILDYPLIGDLHVFSTFQEGFEKMRAHFYAIDSLLNRPDLPYAYLQVYSALDPLQVNSKKGALEIGSHMLKFSLLELLGAQPELLSKLDASRKSAFTKVLINKYELKNKAIDKYGALGLSTTSWTLSHIVNLDAALPAGFKQKGFELETQTLNTISTKAKAAK